MGGGISIDGNLLMGGNIIDLVNHAMKSKKVEDLKGARAFQAVSKPKEFVGNKEFLREIDNDIASTVTLPTSTPKTYKRSRGSDTVFDASAFSQNLPISKDKKTPTRRSKAARKRRSKKAEGDFSVEIAASKPEVGSVGEKNSECVRVILRATMALSMMTVCCMVSEIIFEKFFPDRVE